MDFQSLIDYLKKGAIEGTLSHQIIENAVKTTNLSFHEIEKISLSIGLIPRRYIRNMRTLNPSDQLKLLNSSVAVVGCGGLGCNITEMLARIGVGHLICIDPGYFEEDNLNRQRFCNLKTLGRPKAEVIKEEIENINPAIIVEPHITHFLPDRSEMLLKKAHVVIDALDSFEARIDLSESCKRLAIPLVHGAIAGWYGQLAIQGSDSNKLTEVFKYSCGKRELQRELGNPSFTPAFIAALQVSETIKLLLNKDHILFDKLIFYDLLSMSFEFGQL